jgi:hypothetical protein
MKHLILLLVALALPSVSQAQAYKCKDRASKTFISSKPCQDGKIPVSSVAQEYIPLERRLEAHLAHQRRRYEVDRIDEGYEAAVAAQQRYASQRSAQNTTGYRDKACDAASRPHPGAQNGQLTAAQRSTLASCGGGSAGNQTIGTTARPPSVMPAPPPAPSVITNCDAGGCFDNLGNRYTKGAGSTYFPGGGGSCQMIGGQMHCP